jgi:hypothetical protein
LRTAAFRTSPELEEKLAKLFAFYGVHGDGFSEQMRLFIDELYEKLNRYKDSQQASEQAGEQKPPSEEITCNLRTSLKDSPSVYYCVNAPPRVVKLLGLEVCRVCKALFLNLSTKTKKLAEEIEKAQTAPIQEIAKPPEAQQTQKTGYTGGYTGVPSKHYETIYCPSGGLWVPLTKCTLCKKDAFNVYDTCQRIFQAKRSQPSKT